MRIKAGNDDGGFTRHCLKWTLETEVNADLARVSARWRGGNADFEIPFDGSTLLANLAAMDDLNASYSLFVKDGGSISLEIERDGSIRTWAIHHFVLDELLIAHPELEPFFRFWQPISAAIESELALW